MNELKSFLGVHLDALWLGPWPVGDTSDQLLQPEPNLGLNLDG
jgi:hypothetical protein